MAKRKAKEIEDTSPFTECTICLSNDSIDVGSLACKHSFCFECIESWSEHENSCPLCKKRFSFIDRINKGSNDGNNGSAKKKSRVKIKKKDQLDYEPRSNPNSSGDLGFDIANITNYISALTGSRFHSSRYDMMDILSGMYGMEMPAAPVARRTMTTGRMGNGGRTRTMAVARRSSTAPSSIGGGHSRASSEPIEISDDEAPARVRTNLAGPLVSGSMEVIDLTDDAVEYVAPASSLLSSSSARAAAAASLPQPPQQQQAQPQQQSDTFSGNLSAERRARLVEMQRIVEQLEDDLDDDYEPSLRSADIMSYQGNDSDLSTDNEEEEEVEGGEDEGEQAWNEMFISTMTATPRSTGEVIDLMDDDDEGPVVEQPTTALAAPSAPPVPASSVAASVVASVAVPAPVSSGPSRTSSGSTASTAGSHSSSNSSNSGGAPPAPRPYAGVMVWCRSCDAYHDKQRVWEEAGYCRSMHESLLSSGGFSELSQESTIPTSATPNSGEDEDKTGISISNIAINTTVSAGCGESLGAMSASSSSSSSSSSVAHAAAVDVVTGSNDSLVDLMDGSSDESHDFLSSIQFRRLHKGRNQSPSHRARVALLNSTSPQAAAASSESGGEQIEEGETSNIKSVEDVPDKSMADGGKCVVNPTTESVPVQISRTHSDATTTSSSSRSRTPARSPCDGNLHLLAEAGSMQRAASVGTVGSASALEDSPAKCTRRRTGSLSESLKQF